MDYSTPANRIWIAKKDLDTGNLSALVFPFNYWEVVAGAGKENVIFLLDAKLLGGADHRTPVFRSPLYANEGLNFANRKFLRHSGGVHRFNLNPAVRLIRIAPSR